MTDIQPARRVSDIQEYYFSRKLREVAEMNARGLDVISLGIGGPDRMPHADVIERLCAEAHRPGVHSYQPYVGIPELRRAYAEWYRTRFGVTLDPDKEILPLIGSKEAVLHVSLAFLNPGDGVLVPNPGYPTYTSVSRLVGARVIPYELRADSGWQPDFATLERMDLSGVKLMWANYTNMPTGAVGTPELMQRLVDFGRRHGIVIVHDNPYSFILNSRPLSILSAEGARDIAIELNSLSKSHNMAGWRMGMLAANPTFREWALKVKSNLDSGQFRPMMMAAAEALRLPDKWYADLNDEYARRRRVAEQIMQALGCIFDPAQRGLFLWGRIPDGEASAEAFCDRILYDARVFVTPGSVFGSAGARYLRISLCAPEQTMLAALQRITNKPTPNPSPRGGAY